MIKKRQHRYLATLGHQHDIDTNTDDGKSCYKTKEKERVQIKFRTCISKHVFFLGPFLCMRHHTQVQLKQTTLTHEYWLIA